jgi:hypothetical protein
MTTAVLNVLRPYSGPCAFCGHPDQRHRLADALIENVRAGDSPEGVADTYEVPVDAVRTLVEYAAKRTRQHKARWPE